MPIYRNNHKVVKIYRNNKVVTDIYEDNKHIPLSGGGPTPLPEGFQEVEYLEGDFDNLTVNLKQTVQERNIIYRVKASVDSSVLSSAPVFFITTNYSYAYLLVYNSSDGKLYSSVDTYTKGIAMPKNDNVNDITYDTEGNYYRNGSFIKKQKMTYTVPHTQVNLSRTTGVSFRLYKLMMSDCTSGQSLINLIPCIDESLLPCFYNRATDEVIYVPDNVVAGPVINS